MREQDGNCRFDTTVWTLLGQLREHDVAARESAISTIASRYWTPVYAAVRAMGLGREQASEVTQGFFTDVVLGRRLLESAEQSRGRLRTLLLTALKRYLIDCHRSAAAHGAGRLVSLEAIEREERSLDAGLGRGDPDVAFDRRWAAAVLEEAMRRCERHFRDGNRERHWRAFEARVVVPAVGACEPVPLAQLAAELGFPGAADVGAAVQVVKKRLKALLLEVVSETAEEEREQELSYVMRMLR